MTTTPHAVYAEVPLAGLTLAPENARFGRDQGDVPALAKSIEAAGRLLTPLNVYPSGEGHAVWDGGRRLAALQLLNKPKKSKLPASLKVGVPALVFANADDARLFSLATFVRENMNPADEFLAYKTLFDQGMDATQIAAVCAVTTPRVKQLLRLSGVAPEIVEFVRQGKLALDVAEAFSITTDHEAQRQVLASFTRGAPDAWSVRRALTENALSPRDTLAKLVGREAYEAAGGTFLVDLFSREGEEHWADSGLAQRLADAMIAAKVEEVGKEGWGDVRFSKNSYGYEGGLTRLHGDQWKSKDKKSEGTAFVVLTWEGALKVERGYFKPRRADGTTVAASTPAKLNPGRYGFGHKGHHTMTAVATMATRVALVRNPAAAYDAMLSHLAWLSFGERRYEGMGVSSDTTASTLMPEAGWRSGSMGDVGVKGADEVQAVRERWAARLPTGRVAFCEYIAALSADEKADLLAVSFAQTVDGIEAKTDARRPQQWAHLGWMAKHSGVNIAEAWAPDVDFLKGGSKDALAAGLKAADNRNKTDGKRGELATALAAFAAGENGWRPELLATFTDVQAEPSKVAADDEPMIDPTAAESHEEDDAADLPDEGDADVPPYLAALAGVAEGDPATA